MTKSELVQKIADEAKITKTAANRTIDSLIDAVKASLKKGKDVSIAGFGTFSVAKRKPRKGRNPQTGAEIKIPGKKVPKFKPGKSLKETVK